MIFEDELIYTQVFGFDVSDVSGSIGMFNRDVESPVVA